VTPTTPLTPGQLRRHSPAPTSTILYVIHEAPASLEAYVLASARGDLLPPDGNTGRELERGESARSEGVLLRAPVRQQLALTLAAAKLPTDELTAAELPMRERRNAERDFQRSLQRLGEIGLLHRCTRVDEATLYLRPHTVGEWCAWAGCPGGTFAPRPRYRTTPSVVANDTHGRSERHPVSLADRETRSPTPLTAISNKAATKAEQKGGGKWSKKGGTEGSTAIGAIGESRAVDLAELVARQVSVQLEHEVLAARSEGGAIE
jgi:hypothetical protein